MDLSGPPTFQRATVKSWVCMDLGMSAHKSTCSAYLETPGSILISHIIFKVIYNLPCLEQQSSRESDTIMIARVLARGWLELFRWPHNLLDWIFVGLKLPYLDVNASFNSSFSKETTKICDYICANTEGDVCSPRFFERTFPQLQAILKSFSYKGTDVK